jgi:hypothetical protein
LSGGKGIKSKTIALPIGKHTLLFYYDYANNKCEIEVDASVRRKVTLYVTREFNPYAGRGSTPAVPYYALHVDQE